MSKEFISEIMDTVSENKSFKLVTLRYDEQAFGNTLVKIEFKNLFNVIFIKDRSKCFCEIDFNGRKYDSNDYFSALKIDHDYDEDDFVSMVVSITENIEVNRNRIIDFIRKDYQS